MSPAQPINITVRIPTAKFEEGSVATITVIRMLRAKGVPVIGKFYIRGVSHGELKMFCDAGDLVYVWVGVPDEVESELI